MMAKKKKKTKKQIKQTKSPYSKKNDSVLKNSKKKKPVNHSKKPVRSSSKQVKIKRGKNGRLLKGQPSLNSNGRPKGSLSGARLSELRQSISVVEMKLKFNWLEEQIIKSREDTSLAIAILARLYPSLKSIEQITFATDSMEDEEARQIRNEMLERFRS